jgi:hypothetical protein
VSKPDLPDFKINAKHLSPSLVVRSTNFGNLALVFDGELGYSKRAFIAQPNEHLWPVG